jgi:hypothetical protein
MSFFTSAQKIINRVQGKSSYTFSQHGHNKPAPLNLSAPEYALKMWFEQKKYETAEMQIEEIGGGRNIVHIQVRDIAKLSNHISLCLSIYVKYWPGRAELHEVLIKLDGLYRDIVEGAAQEAWRNMGDDDFGEEQRIINSEKAALRSTVLNRKGCLQRAIDPSGFELWVALKRR